MQCLAATSSTRSLSSKLTPFNGLTQTRCVSSSPYGRTHVWKHRQKVLPKPFVPQFPQRVILCDGSTFTHITTSPRSVFQLPRDTTNNPIWNALTWDADDAEEDTIAGRLGRFNRRFDGIGGHGGDIDWMSGAPEGSSAAETGFVPVKVATPKPKKKRK
ncbi:hypothetical protein PHLCEN_2v7404 [Hermanssonia centrifuga]|uniref:50S ribosomal protein L36 n=1 Tax=Hermanssonia centrifuga TaxID=98765 RepID=A0A2R6NWL7_9APHY|nr:hypothetical protein PHLCEN_2v7404 [Hermanssonia centrifuga]